MAPNFRKGVKRGAAGKPLPSKPEDGFPKAYLLGYAYGRRTLAWRIWRQEHDTPGAIQCDEHGECSPSSELQVETFLKRHGYSR
jgi:hypothetical protein